MPRQFVKDLNDGEAVDEIYLLADKQLRANRNANLYLLSQLRDRTGMISGLMWNVTETSTAGVDAGHYVHVKGKVQLFQSNMQIILTNIEPADADAINSPDFEEGPNESLDRLMTRMREILLSIDDPSIRAVMECFLIDEPLMQRLGKAPAGVKAHHAYPGGLVEHIVNMLETAKRIEDLYPSVNFNLVLAGVFLHDLGKVREMDSDMSLVYTDEGQLLGHMSIGVEMLTEKIAEVTELTGEPFPTETCLRLKHMILSHHGSYEFGSSRLPMTPEAITLHYIDNLDAKIHEFNREIEADPNSQSSWTPFNARISRKIYKGQR